MDELLEQFYHHLGAERGLATLTLESYAHDLQDFRKFLRSLKREAWEEANLEDFQRYLSSLQSRGLSARSRARRLSALRQFFRFLQREERLPSNPVELLDSPRLPLKLPQVLNEQEVEALLAAVDASTPQGQRDARPPGGALCHGPQGVGTGGPDPKTAGPAPGGGAAHGEGP